MRMALGNIISFLAFSRGRSRTIVTSKFGTKSDRAELGMDNRGSSESASGRRSARKQHIRESGVFRPGGHRSVSWSQADSWGVIRATFQPPNRYQPMPKGLLP